MDKKTALILGLILVGGIVFGIYIKGTEEQPKLKPKPIDPIAALRGDWVSGDVHIIFTDNSVTQRSGDYSVTDPAIYHPSVGGEYWSGEVEVDLGNGHRAFWDVCIEHSDKLIVNDHVYRK